MSLKYEDLIRGKIYYTENYGGQQGNNYIYRFDEFTGSGISIISLIGLEGAVIHAKKIVFNEESYAFINNNSIIVEASENQIKHLEACEKALKYIKFEDIIEYETDHDLTSEIDEILKESIKTNNLNL